MGNHTLIVICLKEKTGAGRVSVVIDPAAQRTGGDVVGRVQFHIGGL